MIDNDASDLTKQLLMLPAHRRTAILENVLKPAWPKFRDKLERGSDTRYLRFTANATNLYNFLTFAFREAGMAEKVRTMIARQEGA